MSDKVKLVWDFRGPDAEQIAKHYKVHLDQYAVTNKLQSCESGIEVVSGMYATAYFRIQQSDKERVTNALRPHREE